MKRYNLYIFLLTVLILYLSYTVGVYIHLHGIYRGLLGILIFAIIYIKTKKINKIGFLVYFTIVGGSFFSERIDLPSIIIDATSKLPILTFFMLGKEEIKRVLQGIDKNICFLVLTSFLVYILVMINGPFSSSGLQSYNDQYYYYNYFYIFIDKYNNRGRFSGFTFEPGYLSLLLVSLLLINRFEFKKKSTYVYMVSFLLTVSLGGYILGFIGYVLQKILTQRNIKRGVLSLLAIISFISIIVVFVLSYNNGNNIIVENIIERLIFDEDLGIVGNNRENALAADIIDTYFYSNNVWLGIGSKNLASALDINGVDICSWRVFVVAYGAIYTIMFFVLSIIFLFKTNVRVTLPFFIVYWLDFYQHGTLYSETLYLLLLFMLFNIKGEEFWMCLKQKTQASSPEKSDQKMKPGIVLP